MSKKSNKYKKIFFSFLLILIPFSVSNNGNIVHAIGKSPAFDKGDNISESKLHYLILNDVKANIEKLAPKILFNYKNTSLNKVLSTNYKNIDYPSTTPNTDEGIDSEGNLILSALKKPIKEQSRIDLAELVRYYQYVMSSERKFSPLKSNNGIVGSREDDIDTKLNYFDYVKLIDSIEDNSQYTKEEKVRRLGLVEKDLSSSISILYGDTNLAYGLEGWGNSKTISVPFNREKFSYKQLLAAYDKDDVVISTLDYYSSILDTLDSIREYSVQRRLEKPATIDVSSLAKNVNDKYNKLNEILITPVANKLSVDDAKKAQQKAGEDEESKALQDAGVVENKTDNSSEEDSDE